eukprot:TRINITY_DN5055_c0_g1_i1.p1 TRINITY_DN5055_c0_g1~~TRINITY_DN5055_c0_g1_i1.p1  ORF type:complete len:341 (-),score=82.35 TRINITY_DN5055_c0_g1_i1:175-1176(-)
MAIPADSRDRASALFKALQDKICQALEDEDTVAKFQEDLWTKEGGTGGGRTRVLKNGKVFEQGGVAFSAVTGKQLPPSILTRHPHLKGQEFFATGVSLVIHPRSPQVPTVHMNYRYFEAGEGEGKIFWFGGGADLTPYILNRDQSRAFHEAHRRALDVHHTDLYPVFKLWCDEYFYIKHRQEHRGIGGIFFDYQDGDPTRHLYRGEQPEGKAAKLEKGLGVAMNWEQLIAMASSAGDAFLEAYIPIVQANKELAYSEEERQWQLYRRGRYVEFNLVYDRGTAFGLQTGGRTESILMSLPPLVRWEYCYQQKESEKQLTQVLSQPEDWLAATEK